MPSSSTLPLQIHQAIASLSPKLLSRSGAVFYTGKEAFSGSRALYVLGLNPGGDPEIQSEETIAHDLDDFASRPGPWSAYANARWANAEPGKWGLQPRVLHMLRVLGLDPQAVPASNTVFVRTRSEAALKLDKAELLAECWPIHHAVIEALGVRVALLHNVARA
ncbi:hypothetical protein GCM10011395_35620 [Sphingomonas psychrolutea]|uniref:DUF3293 domain-containing protein n=1 Tax=Sphingomonas psychrolutea TaxID=1259676 RepID=A0ABQ1H7E7_9SPHN|nr:hypothetical protein GCM10011395_35620 [Sphingomonas psychrolutea]